MEAKASRGRFSISAKLILVTTVLVSAVVGLSAWLQIRSTGDIYETQAREQREATITRTRLTGTSTAERMAATMQPRVLGSEWQNLQEELEQLVRGDPDLVEASIVDVRRGRVMAHHDRARVDQPSPHRLTGAALTVQESAERLVVGAPVTGTDFAVWLVYGYERLRQELGRIEEGRKQRTSAALDQALATGLGFLLFGVVSAVVQGLRLSRPITALREAARRIASGDLVTRTDVRSNDEIGELGATFNYMADRIEVLMQETAEKLHLENELAVARAVSETLVPPTSMHTSQSMELAGFYQPASVCGGDWWSYFELPSGRTVILIGDVTGHGVPSAMITAAAKSCCDTVRGMSGDHFSLLQLMSAMNFSIYESARRSFVMTMFVALFDPHRKVVSYVNAAHNFPYVVRANGTMSCLAARGNRLGDRLDSEYGIREEPFGPGDLFVFYTDGLVECTSPMGEEYGEKRLRRAIVDLAQRPVAEVRDEIVARATKFYGGERRKDDITMVVARTRG